MLTGLAQINLELTSRCDKSCFFCGHQDPKIHTSLRYGDMAPALLERLASELQGVPVVQFHRDGEPLLYHKLAHALNLFEGAHRSLVTNGRTLADRADDILDRCESVCLSAFKGDPEAERQDAQLRQFLLRRGRRPLPRVAVKVVGTIEHARVDQWKAWGLPVLWRRIHLKDHSRGYRYGDPPQPEHGICLDLLHKPSIDWQGRVFVCNRLDPVNRGYLGQMNETTTFAAIWEGALRASWLHKHTLGRRNEVPLCKGCEFYGVPAA
jgi:hypothetical protein